jgi:hypothetical protein
MRLTVLVYVITIAAGVAIILPTADDSAKRPTEDRTGDCTGSGAKPRKDRTRDSAYSCADCRPGGGTGNLVIVRRVCRTAAQREAARSSCGNQQMFHLSSSEAPLRDQQFEC